MTGRPSRSSYQVERAIIERDSLLRDCIRLLHQVSRKPNSLKLLSGAKAQLELFAQYKGNRQHTHRRPPSPAAALEQEGRG